MQVKTADGERFIASLFGKARREGGRLATPRGEDVSGKTNSGGRDKTRPRRPISGQSRGTTLHDEEKILFGVALPPPRPRTMACAELLWAAN
jgi:hypothetical protein